ncbi:MAG: DegT/DnrJ/EryC1/StrS family aminotransferase [Acidobacteriota bacterium]|nr:DegT/DnrJ/EryC1/StrS family aminotransferase [Acidobacteriota bacterium]
MQVSKWPISGAREIELLREVLESDRWGGYHEFVNRFEKEFCRFQHCTDGVSAANGTVTLEMALEALGIGDGDEVIVPAISFISTATAVSRMRATPVFVDIEPHSFHVDPECVRRAIGSRTKAIMAVHFGGPMADMDRLCAIAAENNLALIEDAAHAHGSEWRGRRAGSIGTAGSFSFQNSKVMTAGEGGILTSNDAALVERVRSISDQGRKSGGGWFFHYTLGTNYRITAWQAAVLLAQLERLPEQNCRRERNAAALRHEVAGVAGLTLQKVAAEARVHTNYLLLGRVDAAKFGKTRDQLHQDMTAAGVPFTPFYPHTLYRNPAYHDRNCRVEPCPVAEACIRDAFWLPHRVLLGTEDDAREIAAFLRGG